MAHPVVVDLRNVFSPADMAAHGFAYESVGRMPVHRLRRSTDHEASASETGKAAESR
jgi:hypothetical protein